MQVPLSNSNTFLYLNVSNTEKKKHQPAAAETFPAGKLFATQMMCKPIPEETPGQEHTGEHSGSWFCFISFTA